MLEIKSQMNFDSVSIDGHVHRGKELTIDQTILKLESIWNWMFSEIL